MASDKLLSMKGEFVARFFTLTDILLWEYNVLVGGERYDSIYLSWF